MPAPGVAGVLDAPGSTFPQEQEQVQFVGRAVGSTMSSMPLNTPGPPNAPIAGDVNDILFASENKMRKYEFGPTFVAISKGAER